MIEKIPDQIPVQTGEWRGTTFDIIPKETFGMACRKINELIDAVNVLQCKNVHIESDLQGLMYPKEIKCETRSENVQSGTESRSENVQELALVRKALDKGMEHITGLNNMIESWYKLLQSDKDTSTKYAILKSAISVYVENKGGDNDNT